MIANLLRILFAALILLLCGTSARNQSHRERNIRKFKNRVYGWLF
jgi:hypothetical protein